MKKKILTTVVILTVIMACGCTKDNSANPTETSESVAESASSSVSEADTEPVERNVTDAEDISQEPVSEESDSTWSIDKLTEDFTTVVVYDKVYNACAKSEEEGLDAIRQYGEMQRAGYDNPEIVILEHKMEEEFGIASVNLGEMDIDTAGDIYRAFEYMYSTYPVLQGTLNNLSIGNVEGDYIALTQQREFIKNGTDPTPMVIKREIILSDAKFLRRDLFLDTCKSMDENGYWPAGSDISSVVVHELGHHLLDEYIAEEYGFEGCLVTDDNLDAYWEWVSEGLAVNQQYVKRLLTESYEKWSMDNEGSEDDFRASISQYAKGEQSDGGISYSETVAEAFADIYINGDNASAAAKIIVATLTK